MRAGILEIEQNDASLTSKFLLDKFFKGENRMLKKVLIVIAVVLTGFLIYVAVQPAESTISREIVINATPESIFPYINSSQKMHDWMPWRDSDPEMKMEFSGPPEGVGSTSTWKSPGEMGEGSSVIVESNENRSVKSQLKYVKPMEMSQLAEVTLTPVEGGTQVKWSVDGHNGFVFRMVGIIMNIEKMVGDQFDRGLAKLKSIVEGK